MVRKSEMFPKQMEETTSKSKGKKGNMPSAEMEQVISKGDMPTKKMKKFVSPNGGGGMYPNKMETEVPTEEHTWQQAFKRLSTLQASVETRLKTPHVFVLPGQEVAQGTALGAQPKPGLVGFDYPATLRGSTAHFNVYYDPALGTNGQTLADGVLASCEAEYNTLVAYFGGITPASFNIIIAAGIGGAYHWECSATDLYCDASGVDINHTRMLVVAEEVEFFSALQGRGWDCGASNGEGLSRVLATDMFRVR